MIKRQIEEQLLKRHETSKATIVIGPRQVGKTTLIRSFLKDHEFLFLDGDDPSVRKLLNEINTTELDRLLKNHSIVFIDEAQRIQNIGLTLKIIIDQFKDIKVYVSGSSSFELNHQIKEPLTGRKWEFELLPISWIELENAVGYLESERSLETRLIYGMYPDIINSPGDEEEILYELSNSYLFRDLLAFHNIRKPQVLEKLARALAYQVGSEVSYNELAQLVGVDKNTISTYIDILEKGYVLFRLPSFSKNLRNEIKRTQKIYFYDNGTRNALITDFRATKDRNDIGALWENFLVSERRKQIIYSRKYINSYFWRTTHQQEIDYVETFNEYLNAFEFKWNEKAKTNLKGIRTFEKAYQTETKVVTRTNFRDFLK